MEALTLLDACEMTAAEEVSSAYISELGIRIIISKSGTIADITIILDADSGYRWSGIADSIKFRSKITGTATITYGVVKK